jgi:hypothetical protein
MFVFCSYRRLLCIFGLASKVFDLAQTDVKDVHTYSEVIRVAGELGNPWSAQDF